MKYLLFVFCVVNMVVMASSIDSEASANDLLREKRISLNYIPATYQNMSQLVWKYNLHDLNDDEKLTQFLRITDCEMYKKYSEDDFVWKTILEGARRDVEYFARDYPDRFEVKAIVTLDRYDFDKSAFIIDEKYALGNAGAIQIPFGSGGVIASACLTPQFHSFFPLMVKLIAENKFSLTEIPVSPDRADEILKNISKYNYEGIRSNRVLTLRFRVRVNSIEDYKTSISSSWLVFGGQLDELAFFEDPQMTQLVWQKQFKALD